MGWTMILVEEMSVAEKRKLARRIDLWNAMVAVQELHNENPTHRMFVAAEALERQYREEFGHEVPMGGM